jgi:hypothetical protein
MAKLLGNRIYLELPKKEEGKLIVDENTKEALEKEMIKKMYSLTVYAVGTAITDVDLVVGAKVFVDPSALSKALVIPKGDTNVLLVSIFDVVEIL